MTALLGAAGAWIVAALMVAACVAAGRADEALGED